MAPPSPELQVHQVHNEVTHITRKLTVRSHPSLILPLPEILIMWPLVPDTMIQACPWVSSLPCDSQPSLMDLALCISSLQCFLWSHLGLRMSSHIHFLCFSTSFIQVWVRSASPPHPETLHRPSQVWFIPISKFTNPPSHAKVPVAPNYHPSH